ncbi:cytochrome ubiquinol oxidase subunit I, partial [Staphylococcus saprophyticus]|uniref:cytochrome ubiquinol oxidase subunit I n=1 Tax=Staphylococcus saprophyticus TaxID=29385 RepID=UPI0016429D64
YTITLPLPLLTPTIIPLHFSLLSPTFIQIPPHLIPLPLFIQTFPFFFQAIFFTIYLYTSHPFKPKSTHFLITIPVILPGSFSAFFI